MKIALVSDWFLPRTGGIELQMRDLAVQLSKLGHEVEIITGTPGDPVVDGIKVHRIDAGPLLPRFFSWGQAAQPLEPLNVWPLLREWKSCWGQWLVNPLDRVIQEGRFDVVHGHSAFSPFALAACWAARRAKVPCVLSGHSILGGAGRTLMHAAELAWRWSRWPDVITAVSSFVAGEMRAQTRRDIELLPNGVSPDYWTIDALPEVPRVISVMRFMPRKRGVDFVRSIPKVIGQLNWDMPPRFMLVGDGPERQRIESESHKLRVTEHLELPGLLARSQVREALGRSSVFVLPTRREALSIAVLEALSAGLPVVAMNDGGVSDIVTHGREGFLANSYEEFSHYTARLLSDAALRKRMASFTRQAAVRFNWDGVVRRHLDVYELARTRRSGSPGLRAAFGAPSVDFGLQLSGVRA